MNIYPFNVKVPLWPNCIAFYSLQTLSIVSITATYRTHTHTHTHEMKYVHPKQRHDIGFMS